jgi:adenosylmethionine-8-amino-7-oxononanoate aminotransferase
MSDHLLHRAVDLPVVSHGSGCELFDTTGRRYLDGSGGAVVVGVGHGRRTVAEVMARQARTVAHAHGTMFTSEPAEAYGSELARILPVHDAKIYPVSGGSEAIETAFKLARSYHLARGEPSRHLIVARHGSYHGNTRGALDASDRTALQQPYEPWLGLSCHVSAAYEYRCPRLGDSGRHPSDCGARLAAELDETIESLGPHNVAAFVAEPVAGATLGAAVPSDDYWPAVAEVCRRHGVLLVADEVMTGFGRTGRWFGLEHWGVRADLITAAKGASSGYWPLGLVAASGEVADTVGDGRFVNGFSFSHHVVGAAVGLEVLRILREEQLVAASATMGRALLELLSARLAPLAHVGDVRGLGLMAGVELVRDRESRQPYRREERVTERIVRATRERGVLVYSSTGCADGVNGDLVMIAPPFVVTPAEAEEIVEGVAGAIEEVTVQAGRQQVRARP